MDIIEGFLFFMEIEIWKDIPEYEGMYQCSNFGRIKSLERESHNGCGVFTLKERILKNTKMNNGYTINPLCKNGKSKYYLTHCIVAITFLNHKIDGHKSVVDHINGDKLDNRVINLRIVTHRFNLTYGYVKNSNKYTSKYVGVCWSKKNQKWKSTITINKKQMHLGFYKTEIEAYNAYKSKLLGIMS